MIFVIISATVFLILSLVFNSGGRFRNKLKKRNPVESKLSVWKEMQKQKDKNYADYTGYSDIDIDIDKSYDKSMKYLSKEFKNNLEKTIDELVSNSSNSSVNSVNSTENAETEIKTKVVSDVFGQGTLSNGIYYTITENVNTFENYYSIFGIDGKLLKKLIITQELTNKDEIIKNFFAEFNQMAKVSYLPVPASALDVSLPASAPRKQESSRSNMSSRLFEIPYGRKIRVEEY